MEPRGLWLLGDSVGGGRRLRHYMYSGDVVEPMEAGKVGCEETTERRLGFKA